MPSLISEVVQNVVIRPHESLATELKAWIDPESVEGQAKIAKACLALRNQNGGFLVIGFDNSTKLPITDDRPLDVAIKYHGDTIQSIISKFSSHLIEVETFYPERDGLVYPVIQVPTGVTTPVMCKADLRDADRRWLLREGEIYVRTLAANGTVSSARASWRDLDDLMRRCHNNRDADLASILRRMVQGMKKESVREIIRVFQDLGEVAAAVHVTPQKVMDDGRARFNAAVAERSITLPPHGAWETALVIPIENIHYRPNENFRKLLSAANPDLTGWPVWVDSSDFYEEAERPEVRDGRWQALIFDPPDEPDSSLTSGHLDFWIWDPKGEFYLYRGLQDDFRGEGRGAPLTTLEPRLVTFRVAEALAVGQSFARAMQPDRADFDLYFAFRWSGLRKRRLVAWAQPGAYPMHGRVAKDDEVLSVVTLPVSANEDTIAATTHEAILPLMSLFGGYEPPYGSTSSLVERVLQRRL